MVCPKNDNLLDYEDIDVAWDIVGVSFQTSSPFFTSPKASITTDVVSVFISTFVLRKLLCYFHRGVMVRWYCHINDLTIPFSIIFDHDVRFVGIYFSISLDGLVLRMVTSSLSVMVVGSWSYH